MKQHTKQLLIGYFVSMLAAAIIVAATGAAVWLISQTVYADLAIAIPAIVLFLVVIPSIIVITDIADS